MKWKLSSLSHLAFLVLSVLSFGSFQLNEALLGRRTRKQYPLPLARVNNCIVFLISVSNANRVLSIHDRWQDSEGKLLLLPSPLYYPPPLLFPSPPLWPTRIKISCGTVVFKKLDQVCHIVTFFSFYFIFCPQVFGCPFSEYSITTTDNALFSEHHRTGISAQ